jgi:hypothetical protein
MAKKTGRPTRYTQTLADEICAYLAMGQSLRSICGKEDDDPQKQKFPAVRTIFYWLRSNEAFLQQYTRAKQESADAMADEILDISDDGSNDWMERHYGDEDVWVTNGEALQRSKLRVDTRKFLMAKMKPKVYGDKLDLTTDGEKLPAPLLGGISLAKDKKDKS